MKILLDENIDVRFKQYFAETHEVYTVRDTNWNGIKNGALLSLLAENKFDQQNISKLPCLVMVIDVFKNTLRLLQPLIPQILDALQSETKEKLIIIKEK